jgi:hypothetical protein
VPRGTVLDGQVSSHVPPGWRKAAFLHRRQVEGRPSTKSQVWQSPPQLQAVLVTSVERPAQISKLAVVEARVVVACSTTQTRPKLPVPLGRVLDGQVSSHVPPGWRKAAFLHRRQVEGRPSTKSQVWQSAPQLQAVLVTLVVRPTHCSSTPWPEVVDDEAVELVAWVVSPPPPPLVSRQKRSKLPSPVCG